MNLLGENYLLIEPQIGIGFLKFGSSINKIITELRDRAEFFGKIDIVMGESPNDPIYIVLCRESMKLRFDGNYQLLELIEIENKQDCQQKFFNIYYKNEILLGNEKSTQNWGNLTYNKINSIFGPCQLPSSLDENKFIMLKYEGISFLFLNNSQENENFIIYQNLKLIKIVLFGEATLKDSICPENGIPNFMICKNTNYLNNHISRIKVIYDKGIILNYESQDEENNIIKNNNKNKVNNNNLCQEYINSTNKCYSSDVKNKAFNNNHYRDLNIKESYCNKNNEFNNFSLANDEIKNSEPKQNDSLEFENNNKLNKDSFEDSFKDIENKNSILISFGENLDSILFKLKNPNYVFSKSNNTTEYSEYENFSLGACNKEDSDDFYLNYYSLGFDLLIDGNTFKLKNIKLHTNNPLSTEFGIWDRAPFNLELNKNQLRKFNEIAYDGNSSSRKVSEDYNNISNKTTMNNNVNIQFNNANCNSIYDDNQALKLNSNANNLNNQNNLNPESKLDFQIIENSGNTNVNYSNNLQSNNITNNAAGGNIISNMYAYNNFNYNNRRKKENKCSFENEKSITSINESNISLSSNMSENYFNLIITPMIFFIDVISRFNKNSYIVYHKCEQKLNMTIKYYCFDGLIFEILENNAIGSVTIFKTCNPIP